MRSTHESGLTEHFGHSSVYGIDKLWIRMPSITCQSEDFNRICLSWMGRCPVSDRCRAASPGRPTRPSPYDGVDRRGWVARPSWARWPKSEHGVPRVGLDFRWALLFIDEDY
jgi:hypothetical protein